MRMILPTIVAVAVASCGSNSGATNQTNGEVPVENATIAKLTLTSDVFREGQTIPVEFTCDGANRAPTIHWSEGPSGTKSFALVLGDPHAPSGTFRRWGVFGIPASARSVGGAEHVGTEVSN